MVQQTADFETKLHYLMQTVKLWVKLTLLILQKGALRAIIKSGKSEHFQSLFVQMELQTVIKLSFICDLTCYAIKK